MAIVRDEQETFTAIWSGFTPSPMAMADALLKSLGQPAFTWGSGGSLVAANDVRARYLAALRAADQGNYQLLLAFVRS